MTNDAKNEINIDEILSKIKEEIARRKEGFSRLERQDESIHPTMQQTMLFRLIKKLQIKLKEYSFYTFIYNAVYKYRHIIPKYKEQIYIKDLLKYHDEEFIHNVYKTVLEREPDEETLDYYLSRLRKGQLNRVEILGKIRYSKEGKEKRVQVKGLFSRFVLQTLYLVPVFGYALRTVTAIITLPAALQKIQEYEALNNARHSQTANSLNALTEKVSTEIALIRDTLSGKADTHVPDISKEESHEKPADKADVHETDK